jgi:hypothetical protein
VQKRNAFVAVSMLASLCAPFTASADDIVTLAYQRASDRHIHVCCVWIAYR